MRDVSGAGDEGGSRGSICCYWVGVLQLVLVLVLALVPTGGQKWLLTILHLREREREFGQWPCVSVKRSHRKTIRANNLLYINSKRPR